MQKTSSCCGCCCVLIFLKVVVKATFRRGGTGHKSLGGEGKAAGTWAGDFYPYKRLQQTILFDVAIGREVHPGPPQGRCFVP
jgi:hypothetical protein